MDFILEDLKSHTHTLHLQVEQRLDLPTRLGNVVAFQQVLAAFYGFYAPLEAKLADCVNANPIGLDFTVRQKAALIVQDLQHWKIAAAELPMCCDLPMVDSPAAALGCLYVLEGATLGGEIIKRLLEEKLAVTSRNGGSFFTAYGDRVREMWNEFRQAVSQFATEHPEQRKAIINAAEDTFRKFDAWLSLRLPVSKPISEARHDRH